MEIDGVTVSDEQLVEAYKAAQGMDSARKAMDARAKKYGIAAKEGGAVTKPSRFADVADDDFGDPVNYAYPADATHARAALGYFNHDGQREAGGYSEAEWAIIGKRLAERCGRHMEAKYKYEGGKLMKDEEGKSFDMYAVKALAETSDAYIIGAYGMIWGNEQQRDLSPWPNQDGSRGEYFTAETKGLNDLPVKAITFEHDKEKDPDGQPIKEALGITTYERDDLKGRWIEAQIQKGKKYAQMVMQLVKTGALYMSSETANHWRDVAENGEIKRWRTAGYTLTSHPMEPRIGNVAQLKSAYKSLDLNFLPDDQVDDQSNAGALGAAEVAKAKAQATLLQIEIVEQE